MELVIGQKSHRLATITKTSVPQRNITKRDIQNMFPVGATII